MGRSFDGLSFVPALTAPVVSITQGGDGCVGFIRLNVSVCGLQHSVGGGWSNCRTAFVLRNRLGPTVRPLELFRSHLMTFLGMEYLYGKIIARSAGSSGHNHPFYAFLPVESNRHGVRIGNKSIRALNRSSDNTARPKRREKEQDPSLHRSKSSPSTTIPVGGTQMRFHRTNELLKHLVYIALLSYDKKMIWFV